MILDVEPAGCLRRRPGATDHHSPNADLSEPSCAMAQLGSDKSVGKGINEQGINRC
jgi:hypothetical protein